MIKRKLSGLYNSMRIYFKNHYYIYFRIGSVDYHGKYLYNLRYEE